MLEAEQRKYVKMVRVVRKTDEDQNNEMTQLRNNNSQPYFLDQDEDDPEIDQQVPHNVIQDYMPIYQLNNEQNKNQTNAVVNQPAQKNAGNQNNDAPPIGGGFNFSQF